MTIKTALQQTRSLFLIILFLFIFSATNIAQEKKEVKDLMEKVYSKEVLLRDFEIYKQALEKGHGGLYWYTPKDSFDFIFSKAKAAINQDMSLRSFFRILSTVVEKTHDAHTSLVLPKGYGNYYRSKAHLFPFNVYFTMDKVYITKNLSKDSTIVDGSEIISFNGEPIQVVAERIKQSFTSDGYNVTGKHQRMNEHHFALRYWSLFGDLDSIKLKLKNPNDSIEYHAFQADTYKMARKFAKERYKPQKRKLLLDVLYLNNKTAILVVNSFSSDFLKTQKLKFKPFIRKTFKEIDKKGIETLILDVRKNNGGYAHFVDFLTQYFLTEKFQYYTNIEVKTKKTYLDNGVDEPIKITPFDGFPDKFAGFLFEKTSENFYQRKKINPIKPHKKHLFKGKLYVLISGKSVSGGSKFPSSIYRLKRGILIGEETRGGFYGNTAGYLTLVELPNTKIQLRLPFINHRNEIQTDIPQGSGVVPHHTIVPTIEDIINGKDPVLKYVIKLIKEGK